MNTVKFESQDQLNQIFDCRYARPQPCEGACEGACPLSISTDECEAAYFYGMEGRPAYGTRIVVGRIAVETRTGADGRPEVVEEEA